MDRQRIEDCLVQVVAYQASGKKAKQWAAEQGVPLRHPASWCAHARRWRARLDGAPAPATPRPQPRPRPSGFVQAGSTQRAGAQVQDVSEQLDFVPAQFFVHGHIRGKYACKCCQSIQAAALPAQIIDKGIPAAGLLAQIVVAKHDDHLSLYRQEEIYARSGVHIARSSMAQWVGICGVRLAPLANAL